MLVATPVTPFLIHSEAVLSYIATDYDFSKYGGMNSQSSQCYIKQIQTVNPTGGGYPRNPKNSRKPRVPHARGNGHSARVPGTYGTERL